MATVEVSIKTENGKKLFVFTAENAEIESYGDMPFAIALWLEQKFNIDWQYHRKKKEG